MIILTLLLLTLMEISLSFDNAVINAKILQDMSPVWQRRFILWGMPVAVMGMRLVFPIVIVALAAKISLTEVVNLAVAHPDEYARHLTESHVSIAAFGGIFLLMVFFKFMFDSTKEVHWIKWVEKHSSIAGKIDCIEISIVLTVILILQYLLPGYDQAKFTLAAISGLLVYIFIDGLMGLFTEENSNVPVGIMGFIYLEVLDASCSLDGVIGAFVLTNNIILIMIGLGAGALCIRSLTLYLVRGGALKEFIYLEHGAHWGIGALAVIMLANLFYEVPEPVTGLIGMSFIGLSLLSSVRQRNKNSVAE